MTRTTRNKCYHLFHREPKWWRRMMKHKKRRASTKEALDKLNKGDMDMEEAVFPLDKKPWIYFW